MIAIELNDAGILVAENRQLILESPGYALLEKDRLVIGHEAYTYAQTKPRLINNLFWERIGLEPLTRSVPGIATHADLVREHLAHIAGQIEGDEAILVVPATFTKNQLGLVLGIARQLSIPFTGMIDTAVAAAKPDYPVETVIHLDIQLHQIVLTVLEQGAKIARRRFRVLTDTGLIKVHEAWITLIAGQFIEQTRFDPLHHGASAQRLHERLPNWYETIIHDPKPVLEFAYDESVYRITLRRDHWETMGRSLFESVLECIDSEIDVERAVSIQISHRLSVLPGFIDYLKQRVHCDITQLKRGAAPLGALRLANHIVSSNSQSVALTLSIPAPRRQHSPSERLTPSHIVFRGRAYPIGPGGLVFCRLPDSSDPHLLSSLPDGAEVVCTIENEATDVHLAGQLDVPILLNDAKATFPASLCAGDTMVCSKDQYELFAICVMSPNEA